MQKVQRLVEGGGVANGRANQPRKEEQEEGKRKPAHEKRMDDEERGRKAQNCLARFYLSLCENENRWTIVWFVL